jgi:hypothetical protein
MLKLQFSSHGVGLEARIEARNTVSALIRPMDETEKRYDGRKRQRKTKPG